LVLMGVHPICAMIRADGAICAMIRANGCSSYMCSNPC
jgi:hypothetical protein